MLLLDAIKAASYVHGDGLIVDRQAIRDYLSGLEGHRGLTGTLSCDDFGDCGAGRITVAENLGGEENAEASMSNVVFCYAPPAEERAGLVGWSAGQPVSRSAGQDWWASMTARASARVSTPATATDGSAMAIASSTWDAGTRKRSVPARTTAWDFWGTPPIGPTVPS